MRWLIVEHQEKKASLDSTWGRDPCPRVRPPSRLSRSRFLVNVTSPEKSALRIDAGNGCGGFCAKHADVMWCAISVAQQPRRQGLVVKPSPFRKARVSERAFARIKHDNAGLVMTKGLSTTHEAGQPNGLARNVVCPFAKVVCPFAGMETCWTSKTAFSRRYKCMIQSRVHSVLYQPPPSSIEALEQSIFIHDVALPNRSPFSPLRSICVSGRPSNVHHRLCKFPK